MKTIDDLLKEWDQDSIIDDTNLGHESLNTPKIQSKYLRYLSDTKLILRKLESDMLRLRGIKTRYFRGEMTQEELKERNWIQYQGLKPLKSDMDSILDSDQDVMRISEKIDYYKTFVSSIEYIMKELNSRHWAIRAAIDYHKIQNGLV